MIDFYPWLWFKSWIKSWILIHGSSMTFYKILVTKGVIHVVAIHRSWMNHGGRCQPVVAQLTYFMNYFLFLLSMDAVSNSFSLFFYPCKSWMTNQFKSVKWPTILESTFSSYFTFQTSDAKKNSICSQFHAWKYLFKPVLNELFGFWNPTKTIINPTFNE